MVADPKGEPMRREIKPPTLISFQGIPGDYYIKSDIDEIIQDLEYQIKGLTIDKKLFDSIMENFTRLTGHMVAIHYSLKRQEERNNETLSTDSQ